MSRFQTTRWSLIEAARDDPDRSRAALEELCAAYRPPVLAYVRHSGYGRADAEDLTQSFFLRFLESGWYGRADPERGRFRSLLLTTLRQLHALRVGTLDSYFLQVATSFGQELGLPPGWSICEEQIDELLQQIKV